MAETKKSSPVLVVKAPLVRVLVGDRFVYLYRGDSLNGVQDDEVARLMDLDMVGEDPDGMFVPGVAAHPGE